MEDRAFTAAQNSLTNEHYLGIHVMVYTYFGK